ncbi:MAG: hypothetical protein IH627_04750, partial [Rubrivivax sp.]|nr:hypothetical protein [Rubrivivax sp.]
MMYFYSGQPMHFYSGVDNGVRPFLEISQWVNQQRQKYTKKDHPFENAFYKLIGNNIYGKVAQGLRARSDRFDTRTGSSARLERSKISDAYVAAYVTGLVRATTSEILYALPDDVLVGNTITDGICCTADEMQIEAATKGPQCQFFAELRQLITGNRKIIENKATSRGMVFMRTRMHGSLNPEGGKPILAKVNMPMGHLRTPEGEALSDEEKNKELIREFLERQWDKARESESLTTAKKIWDKEGDLLTEEKRSYVGMDYDLKRRPTNPTERPIEGYSTVPHLAFETRAWRTYDEYAKARKALDKFKEPLKLLGDLEALLQDIDTYGDKKKRS